MMTVWISASSIAEALKSDMSLRHENKWYGELTCR